MFLEYKYLHSHTHTPDKNNATRSGIIRLFRVVTINRWASCVETYVHQIFHTLMYPMGDDVFNGICDMINMLDALKLSAHIEYMCRTTYLA